MSRSVDEYDGLMTHNTLELERAQDRLDALRGQQYDILQEFLDVRAHQQCAKRGALLARAADAVALQEMDPQCGYTFRRGTATAHLVTQSNDAGAADAAGFAPTDYAEWQFYDADRGGAGDEVHESALRFVSDADDAGNVLEIAWTSARAPSALFNVHPAALVRCAAREGTLTVEFAYDGHAAVATTGAFVLLSCSSADSGATSAKTSGVKRRQDD